MSEELKTACKKARGKITAQEIADGTGLPLATVNNFFSDRSKEPSIYTAVPICRYLHVSIDDTFGITKKPDPVTQATVDGLKGVIDVKNQFIVLLSAVCLVLMLIALRIDRRSADVGFIRGGEMSITGVLIVAAVLLVIGFALFWNLYYWRLRNGKTK